MISVEDHDTRIRRLELRVRMLQRALLAVLAVPVVFFVTGAAKPRVRVAAQEFVLVDASGAVRARLDMSKSGTPALLMYHSNGTLALEIGVSNELPAILQFDRNGRTRVDFGLDPAGNPSIVLNGESIKTGVIVRSTTGERNLLAP